MNATVLSMTVSGYKKVITCSFEQIQDSRTHLNQNIELSVSIFCSLHASV